MRNKKTQTQTPPSIRVELKSEKQFLITVDSERLEAVVRGHDMQSLKPVLDLFMGLHLPKIDFSLN